MPSTVLLAQCGSQKQSMSSIVALHKAHSRLAMSVCMEKQDAEVLLLVCKGGKADMMVWQAFYQSLAAGQCEPECVGEERRTCTAECWQTLAV